MSASAYVRLEDGGVDGVAESTPNFDRLARLYRWMEWFSFGPYLSGCRRAFLPQLREARRALVLGDGDGRFTAALLRSNPQVQVDALDISAAMVQGLSRRAGDDADRVRAQVQDVRHWTPAAGTAYETVATHFFLDCLSTDEVRSLARRLRSHIAPGAQWVVSEFDIPRSWFGQLIARPLIAFLYGAFRVMTGLAIRRLPDYHRGLTEAGFTLIARQTQLRGLLVSEIWSPKAEGRDDST